MHLIKYMSQNTRGVQRSNSIYIPHVNPLMFQKFDNITLQRKHVYDDGNDQRYNKSHDDDDFDPTLYEKYKLYNYLCSNDSIVKKIDMLDYNSYLFNISMVYNLTMGGLFNDFHFDFF